MNLRSCYLSLLLTVLPALVDLKTFLLDQGRDFDNPSITTFSSFHTAPKAVDNDNNTYAATNLKIDLHRFTLPLKASYPVHSVILQNIDQTFGEDENHMRFIDGVEIHVTAADTGIVKKCGTVKVVEIWTVEDQKYTVTCSEVILAREIKVEKKIESTKTQLFLVEINVLAWEADPTPTFQTTAGSTDPTDGPIHARKNDSERPLPEIRVDSPGRMFNYEDNRTYITNMLRTHVYFLRRNDQSD
ncbi:hypothetical protein ACHWQZ_G003611 [Mnemiopsis leidyi]